MGRPIKEEVKKLNIDLEKLSMFEPAELAERFQTPEDIAITAKDIPERI